MIYTQNCPILFHACGHIKHFKLIYCTYSHATTEFSYLILLVQLAFNFLNVIHNPIFLEIKYIFGSVTSFIFIQIKFCQRKLFLIPFSNTLLDEHKLNSKIQNFSRKITFKIRFKALFN